MSMPMLDLVSRVVLVYALLLLLLILNAVSFALPFAAALQPSFVLIAVYFWAVYRPRLLPPVALLVIGIILDALLGLPFGLQALLFLLLYALLRAQRHYLSGQTFLIQWLGFTFVVIAVAIVQWIVIGFIGAGFVPVHMPLVQAFVTALLYPIVILPLFALHRLLPLPRKLVS